MDDDVEKLAEEICKTNPTTVDGTALAWKEIVQSRPDQAAMYREAAANRIRAEAAMRRLDELPARRLTD